MSDSTQPMTSNRPYLIRALYDWILDNGMTPHLVIDAERDDVEVPPDRVADGRIVLNVAPSAIQGLSLDNDLIAFNARFDGQPFHIAAPPAAILAIYARETSMGMVFPEEPEPESAGQSGSSSGQQSPDGSGGGGKPSLKVVK